VFKTRVRQGSEAGRSADWPLFSSASISGSLIGSRSEFLQRGEDAIHEPHRTSGPSRRWSTGL
jgi:hypothetical protein